VRSIVAIVEGHGEVQALPVLLRRIALESGVETPPDIPRPIRTPRSKLLKEGELERAIELAARQSSDDGGILILLDADDDCPKEVAEAVLERAVAARGDRVIRVVLAKREYEAWFLAAAESIAGRRGIREDLAAPDEPEALRDAKGWLSSRMESERSYRETLDQAALSGVFDLSVARERSPSFAKMFRDVASLLE